MRLLNRSLFSSVMNKCRLRLLSLRSGNRQEGCARRDDWQHLAYLRSIDGPYGVVASQLDEGFGITHQENRAKSLSWAVQDPSKASKGAITVKGNGMVPARATGEEGNL